MIQFSQNSNKEINPRLMKSCKNDRIVKECKNIGLNKKTKSLKKTQNKFCPIPQNLQEYIFKCPMQI